MPQDQGPSRWDTQNPQTDNTVEEIRIFVRRLKKRWPDLCVECKSVIREALN
jgi:hypothetical protein